MRSSAGSPRPLIEQCDGADADDRAAVASAFLRIWRQQSKAGVTDLHCEQFILAVFATDKRRTGVQWSYGEIADRLRVSIPTARKIVERCVQEFGLICVVEERYARGGQAANKYLIDWQMVRAINAGFASRGDISRGRGRTRPADTTDHPGDTTGHAPATTDHPYKECPSVLTSISPPLVPQNATATPGGVSTWEEVEEVLFRLPKDRRMSDWRTPLQAARQSGVTPDYVLSLLRFYEAKGAAYKPGALYHRMRHCDPRVAPDDGWPQPDTSVSRASAVNDEAQKTRIQSIERRVCHECRPQKLSDDVIRARIAAELQRQRLNPQLSDWCRVAPQPTHPTEFADARAQQVRS